MNAKRMMSVAALVLRLTALPAHAGEGSGDPFPYSAPAQFNGAPVVVADAGSEALPELKGFLTQPPPAVRMLAAYGSEAPVQSVNSLPALFTHRAVMTAQARRPARFEAMGQVPVQVARVFAGR